MLVKGATGDKPLLEPMMTKCIDAYLGHSSNELTSNNDIHDALTTYLC